MMTTRASSDKTWTTWKLITICLLIGIVAGVSQGQDANWDLKNYHYYAPHAWVYDRYEIDVAPAQLQTWHSPYADLPYYWMAKWDFHSLTITGLLSLPAGISLFLLLLIARQLCPALNTRAGTILLLLISVTGAAGARNIGTTMSEWHLCALILAAILCLLRVSAHGNAQLKLFFLAGLFGGMAVGLKLTSAPFAIGLAAMCLCLPCSIVMRTKGLMLLALGGIVGTALFLGPWAWAQYERYGSPLFPYFNNIFKSPQLPELDFRDARFGINSAVGVLSLPIRLTWNSASLVSEVTMRDPRLLFAFISIAALLWPMREARKSQSSKWIPLIIFFVASYLCWVVFFGIYRYIVPLEILAGLFILAAFAKFQYKHKHLNIALIAITVLVIAMTRTPSWGRTDHGKVAVHAKMPSLPPNAMVVIASLEPISYVVPSLPQDVRTIAVFNNFMHNGHQSLIHQKAIKTVNTHEGPLFRLLNATNPNERHYDNVLMDVLLAKIGFSTQRSDCLPIVTVMQPSGLVLCPLVRLKN